MDEKDFFAKLAGVGPDGKFSNFSQKKNGSVNGNKNGNGFDAANKRQNYDFEDNSGADNGNPQGNLQEQEIEIFDGPEGQLAVDVYSTPTHFMIEAAIAGVKTDDIDVSITAESVVIKGKRHKESKEEGKDYILQECFWGRFVRSINLPEEIDADKSHASFKNGILKIVLPKVNRGKAKKLRVKFD